MSIWTDKFGYRFGLRKTRLVSFPSKSLNNTVIMSFLQKLSTWVTAKSNISTRIDFLLLTSVTFWEQLQCVAYSPLIKGMTIALLFSLGTCIVQIKSVWVHFVCTKRLFNLSAEAITNAHSAHLCARCGIFLLQIKQNAFSCRFVKGFTFLKRFQNQLKMSLETCIVPVTIVSTEKNVNLLVVMYQLRDPFNVVSIVEPGCLFTKFLSRYKST